MSESMKKQPEFASCARCGKVPGLYMGHPREHDSPTSCYYSCDTVECRRTMPSCSYSTKAQARTGWNLHQRQRRAALAAAKEEG